MIIYIYTKLIFHISMEFILSLTDNMFIPCILVQYARLAVYNNISLTNTFIYYPFFLSIDIYP